MTLDQSENSDEFSHDSLPELVEFFEWLNSQRPSEKVRPFDDDKFEDKLYLVIQKFLEEKEVVE